MPRLLAASLALAPLLLASSLASAADTVLVKSTFDDGPDGWTSNTPAEVAWQKTGGNPKGQVVFNDQTGAGTYIDAPSSFLSPAINYTALDGKAYIAFQHKIGAEGQIQSVGPYEIRLSGPGGAAKFDGGTANPADPSWKTAVAPLVEADWTVTSGTWSGLLANVTDMQIDIELVTNANTGEDTEYMDNIEIVSHPAGFSPGAK